MHRAETEFARGVADLMRAPLGDFVQNRNDMAKRLRAQQQTDVADRLAALRKPSVSLWALNHAADAAPRDVDALRSAGDRLRNAQQNLLQGDRSAADRMSQAMHDQRGSIDAVTRRLGMVLSAAGHASAEDTMRRVSDGLRNASIADAETWAALREGRLLSEPAADSFPALDVSGMQRVVEDRVDVDADARRKRLAAAEADVRRAEELQQAAQEQADAALRRLEQANEALSEARAALSRLQKERT